MSFRDAFIRSLFFNISRHSKTIKKLAICNDDFHGRLYVKKDYEEMENAVKRNCTLEEIVAQGPTMIFAPRQYPFQSILRLNKAGRRYLANDGQSQSKCIAVLAKVKNDLDCLYFHMRENPILCLAAAAANSNSSIVNDKKRKASDESISTNHAASKNRA